MKTAKMTLASTVLATTFGLAVALGAAPVLANPPDADGCHDHKPCGGGNDGDGGEVPFEALLIGDGSIFDVGIQVDNPNQCVFDDNTIINIGPLNTDVMTVMELEALFETLRMEFGDKAPGETEMFSLLPDQIIGFGAATSATVVMSLSNWRRLLCRLRIIPKSARSRADDRLS